MFINSDLRIYVICGFSNGMGWITSIQYTPNDQKTKRYLSKTANVSTSARPRPYLVAPVCCLENCCVRPNVDGGYGNMFFLRHQHSGLWDRVQCRCWCFLWDTVRGAGLGQLSDCILRATKPVTSSLCVSLICPLRVGVEFQDVV